MDGDHWEPNDSDENIIVEYKCSESSSGENSSDNYMTGNSPKFTFKDKDWKTNLSIMISFWYLDYFSFTNLVLHYYFNAKTLDYDKTKTNLW